MSQTDDAGSQTDDAGSLDDAGFELADIDMAWFMLETVETGRRLYDVLLALLAAQTDADKARELQELHESGRYLFPPAWSGDNDA